MSLSNYRAKRDEHNSLCTNDTKTAMIEAATALVKGDEFDTLGKDDRDEVAEVTIVGGWWLYRRSQKQNEDQSSSAPTS
jgi:hypothetical protein